MFMSQKGELKLPGVTQGPEVWGCDRRWPDSDVCVLGPKAELLGLPTTLEPATAGLGVLGAELTLCRQELQRVARRSHHSWGPWPSCHGQRRRAQGRGGRGRGLGPAASRGPREPRGPARPSGEACRGPAGDLGGSPPARPQAERALGVGLRLPVCPSEPVIHALGQGSNQLQGAPCHRDRWARGSCREPLCEPRAQPRAGTGPAGTECLQFLRDDDGAENSRCCLWGAEGGLPEAGTTQSPAPPDLEKASSTYRKDAPASGSQSCPLRSR